MVDKPQSEVDPGVSAARACRGGVRTGDEGADVGSE